MFFAELKGRRMREQHFHLTTVMDQPTAQAVGKISNRMR